MAPVIARSKVSTRRGSRSHPPLAGAVKPTDFAQVYGLAPSARIQLVKEGISAADVATVARRVGQPKEYLVRVLGLPRATVDRKAQAKQSLTLAQGERLLGFAKLVGQVQVMVERSGDPDGFDAARWLGEWLERPLPALGGRRPSEFMDTGEGQQLIASLLAKAQSGAYA